MQTQTDDTNAHAKTGASPHTNTKMSAATAANGKLGHYKTVGETKEETYRSMEMTSLWGSHTEFSDSWWPGELTAVQIKMLHSN